MSKSVALSPIADPLTRIAFSLYEGKGVFAVLVGSGVSRAAEIPTGWEITLDLVRRVGLAQGAKAQPDWAAWYKEQTGAEPNYSRLVEELGTTAQERRSILHSYIEPTEEEREQGRKVPTAAHKAIADLVVGGYVKVIVTTNFDRLIESALRERGIEPTVVSSTDAMAGAEPLAHSACYVLKLHGDYKDARILNTESELAAYPRAYDQLLDRIFDEYGLIVSGWSGEWDHALRAAMLRAPNRRYPVFWTIRGKAGDGAAELIAHRDALVVPIADADGFFTGLSQRVATLEQSRRQDPLSVELLVAGAKRFLAKPEYRIQLDDLVGGETAKLIEALNEPEFKPDGTWSQEEFRRRVKRYESVSEGLASIAGVLGRWGDGSELPLVLDSIVALQAHGENVGGGLVVYLNIRSYPAVLVFTAYGLGLVRSGRWAVLHELFSYRSRVREERAPQRLIETLFLTAWKGTEQEIWKQLEGLEQRKTALSDHLLVLFEQWSRSFVGTVPSLDELVERFEILGSLAYLEAHEKAEVAESLAQNPHNGWTWMPVGRSVWHTQTAKPILEDIAADAKKALMSAGFGRADAEFIDLFVQNYGRMSARMRW